MAVNIKDLSREEKTARSFFPADGGRISRII
jgi:hypothetical protein